VKDVTAVILGGGRGTRLFPLTLERAKPAVAFAGKYRLIDLPISNCINSGIKRVFVLTQFLSASLHRHIMQTYAFDNFTDGFIDILAAEQTPQGSDWFQGTADAVRATMHHTSYYRSQDTLILSGDHLYRMDYADLVEYHRDTDADISICAYPVERSVASEMGLMSVSPDGEIKEFVEKPTDEAVINAYKAPTKLFEDRGIQLNGERFLASMGIYVFKQGVLGELLKNKEHTDFGHDVIPSALANCKVMAYPFNGHWMDIGTITSFFEANIALAQPEPPFSLYSPKQPIYTRSRSLPPSRIIRSEIRDSLVVEGSDVTGAFISDSIVGVRSIIKRGTVLRDVVMLGADFYENEEVLTVEDSDEGLPELGIGRSCVIERAILDKNVRIGDNVVIRARPDVKEFKGDLHWIIDGITIIPKGTVIPPGTTI